MSRPLGAPMGEMEFLGWLGQAGPGEVLVYHRGFLAVDRHWAEGGALDRLVDRAAWAAGHGLASGARQVSCRLSHAAFCRVC